MPPGPELRPRDRASAVSGPAHPAHGPSRGLPRGLLIAPLRALLCAALLCVVTVVAARPAAAQQAEPTSPPLLQPSHAQLKHSWAVVQALLDKEDWSEALVQIDRLYEVQLDHGARNLFGPGLAIVRAAIRAADGGDVEAARRLAKAAQRLAPDLPAARYQLARIQFDADRLALGPVVSELSSGLTRLVTFLPDRMRFEANAIGTGLFAFLLAAFVFAVALVARYLRLAAHDLMHVFPKGVSVVQATFFTALLLVFPFAFGVGIVYLVIYWIFAVWLYMRVGERVAAALVLVAIGAMPWASHRAVRAAGFSGSTAESSWRCVEGLCGPLDEARLEAAAQQEGGRDTHMALLALGTTQRRAAALEPQSAGDAHVTYERALALEPKDPVALTGLGNLAVIQAVEICKRSGQNAAEEKYQEADAYYQRALEADAAYQPALYNRSVLLRSAGDGDAADDLYRRAQAVDEDALYQFEKEVSRTVPVDRCPTAFNGNRHLIDPAPDREGYVAATLEAPLPEETPLFVPYANLLVGRIGHGAQSAAAAGALIAGLLLLVAGRALRRSHYCGHCGKVACSRCRSELADLDICDACLYFRIKGSFVDPKDLWFRERRIQANETLRRRLMRGLTFVLPGAGHLYRGRTFRGLVLLVLFVASVLGAAGGGAIMPDPTPIEPAWAWLRPTLLSAAAAVLYVIALVDIYSIRAAR